MCICLTVRNPGFTDTERGIPALLSHWRAPERSMLGQQALQPLGAEYSPVTYAATTTHMHANGTASYGSGGGCRDW